MKRICMLLLPMAAVLSFGFTTEGGGKEGWMSLFNGKDLGGWDTWLGKPHDGKEIIGLNKDPQGVYSVTEVDGKPAVRISGEVWGAITSKKEYSNYHFKLEFKW